MLDRSDISMFHQSVDTEYFGRPDQKPLVDPQIPKTQLKLNSEEIFLITLNGSQYYSIYIYISIDYMTYFIVYSIVGE